MYLREALDPACWIYRDSQVLPYTPSWDFSMRAGREGLKKPLFGARYICGKEKLKPYYLVGG